MSGRSDDVSSLRAPMAVGLAPWAWAGDVTPTPSLQVDAAFATGDLLLTIFSYWDGTNLHSPAARAGDGGLCKSHPHSSVSNLTRPLRYGYISVAQRHLASVATCGALLERTHTRGFTSEHRRATLSYLTTDRGRGSMTHISRQPHLSR
ncbi:unnamed protein product, partial [Iphiclides podalirius]